MSKRNRAGFTKKVLDGIWAITRSKENVEFNKAFLEGMSDAIFDDFAAALRREEKRLSIVVPNFTKNLPTVEEIMAVAEKLGHNFFEKLYVEGKDGLPTYLTPVEFLILMVPARRASQLLTKKVSAPPHTKVRDAMTGQVTGESKGARLSAPEVQLLTAMGAEASAIEGMKYRGGDLRGEAAMTAMLSRFGRATQQALSQYASGVVSTKTVATFLTCAMHRSNLAS